MPPKSWSSCRQPSESARECAAPAPALARTPEPHDVIAPPHAAGRNDEGLLRDPGDLLHIGGFIHRPEGAASAAHEQDPVRSQPDSHEIANQDDEDDAQMSMSTALELGPLLPEFRCNQMLRPGTPDGSDGLRTSGTPTTLNDASLISKHHQHSRFDQSEATRDHIHCGYEVCQGPCDLDSLQDAYSRMADYKEKGLYDDAEHVCKWVIRGRERLLGPAHTLTLDAKHMLSSVYSFQGRLADSEAILQNTIDAMEKTVGPVEGKTLLAICHLAIAYWNQGRLNEAAVLFERITQGFETVYGGEHRLTLTMTLNLGRVYREQGECRKAEPLVSRVLEAYRKMLEPKDWRLHIAYFEMVLLYVDMRKYDKAEAILGDELQNCEHISRTSDVDISTASDDLFTLLNRIGLVCLCDSNPGRAEDFLTRALQGYEKRHGPDHLSTLDAVSNLAEVYIFQEKYEKAKEYNRRVRQGLEKIPEATNVSILASLHQQGKIYHNLERHEEAKEVFVRVANEYESTLESGRIETRIPALTNMEFLGDLLDDMGQKKEALSYYRRAGVGFVNLYGHDHERCQDLNRIIQSLEGW